MTQIVSHPLYHVPLAYVIIQISCGLIYFGVFSSWHSGRHVMFPKGTNGIVINKMSFHLRKTSLHIPVLPLTSGGTLGNHLWLCRTENLNDVVNETVIIFLSLK